MRRCTIRRVAAGRLFAGLPLLLSCVLAAALAGPVAAQNATAPDPYSELSRSAFDQLVLEPEVFAFPDPEFARIAREIELGIASMQERRWWYRAAERYAPFHEPPPQGWKLDAWHAGEQLATAEATIYKWVSLGPNGDYDVSGINGGPGAQNQGRATAVWTHMEGSVAFNKNVIYLGFADGGVWRSLDGGDHWQPLIDFQPTLSVGAIDVWPGQDLSGYSDAIVYVGTGEGNFSIGDKDGVGVLKSLDGGRTWEVQPLPWREDERGLPGLHRIRRLRIDRSVPGAQSVWVAGDGGVYHSADGGASWRLVTGLPYSGAPAEAAFPGGCWTEFATDLLIDSTNRPLGHSTLLAAFGRYADAACASPTSEARRNNGVYRSIDGGGTWEKISLSGQNGFPALPGLVGRVGLLQAPSNPKHVYVLIARSDNYQSHGIFDTVDATAPVVQWRAGSTTNYVASQGWYDMTGAVSPTDENRLIVGGLDNYLSTDAGATLTKISGWSAGDHTWAHADHHHAVWVDDATYYDANDGGLNVGIIDGTDVRWIDKNGDRLSTLQFYGLSQSATDPYKINAGLQDNGHALLLGGVWRETYGGDGGFAATDQRDDSQAYEEYVYAAIRHSDDGGQTWPLDGCMQTFGGCAGTCGIGAVCVPDQHAAFIANFTLDTHNQEVMYVGTNYVYRNVQASSAGKVWQRLASDGLAGDFVHGATSSRAYVSIVHTPRANRVAPPLPGLPPMSNILYLGTSTGRVWRSDDGGTTWRDLTKAPLPVVSLTAGRFVTWIDTDPTDADRVVVTYSGWDASTIPAMPGHVFRSTDGGETWTDVSGALPDEPFNSIAVNPNPGRSGEIFAASDTSIFLNRSGWSGDSWVRINNGMLPHVSINMLQYTNATEPKRLRAATHGRGIWELFEQDGASLALDRTGYGCADEVQIELLTSMVGAGSQRVTVVSAGEPGGEPLTLLETPSASGRFAGPLRTTGGSAVAGDGAVTVLNADRLTVTWSDLSATADVDCSACDGSGAAGANLRVPEGSVATRVEGGDGDEFLDNCESATVRFEVANVGSGSLTNVRVAAVESSNPAVRPRQLPAPVAGSVAACATAAGELTLDAAGLTASEPLELTLEITSDELAALGITRSVVVGFAATEQDFEPMASLTFDFEDGMQGWQTVAGTFGRVSGVGSGLSEHYLATSSLADGACDQVRSPVVKLSPSSTLSIDNQFAIEPLNDAWYDRANVGLFDVGSGERQVVVPSGGRPYLADGPNGVCATAGQPGWAGPGPGWLPSTWSADDLGAATVAGRKVQVDVAYGTDPLASGTGLQIDQVTLTNLELQVADAQPDACPRTCEIDDGDAAVEYTGGWHSKAHPDASGGSYTRRVGNNPQGAAARVVFGGPSVTLLYAVASAGGTADVLIDGAVVRTLSFAGQGAVSFGRTVTFSGLGAGSHELRLVHRSGAVYVDGFRFDCAAGGSADAGAPTYRSQTAVEVLTAESGALVTRTVEIGTADAAVSVLLEGLPQAVTVELLGPLGTLVAGGGQLLPGFAASGLDAAGLPPGTYTVRFPNGLLPGGRGTLSVAKTVRAR